MLYKIYKEKLEAITKSGMFSIFPKCSDREQWEKIDNNLRSHIINEGEVFLGYDWPRFKATDYMEYYKEGSRKSWDTVFKSVFDALTKLVIAECIEGKGRFLDDITNGVWARCEDTSWVHTGHLKNVGEEHIPIINKNYLDLRTCSTGSQLAHVYYFLKPQLDEISPLICKRIEYEIQNRIIDCYIENDYWWMNLTEGGTINNWNPHCNKNIIRTAMIMEKDDSKLKAVMNKALKSLDVFLSIHADDGACDEGPGYWKGAGFSYLTILSFLSEIYGISIDSFLDDRIKNMGSYIYKVIISDDFYMSYADGNGRNPMYDVKLYKTALSLEDKALMELATDTFKIHRERNEFYDYFIYILHDYAEYIMGYDKIKGYVPTNDKAYYQKDSILPDAHIAAYRQNKASADGFFVGIKGGHNDESHNHNDIGVVYVYYNGQPVIIDVGAGMYTIKTFSPDRYDIWTMQSKWHSLPVINGFMQKDGIEFKSSDFNSITSDDISIASMNVAAAYPSETGIRSFVREIALNRMIDSVMIADSIEMNESCSNITFNMTVLQKPIIDTNGAVTLSNGLCDIILDYDTEYLEPYVEKKDVRSDKKLSESWGSSIFRLSFKMIKPIKKHTFKYTFNARRSK